jgi:hypothetical protein
LSSRPLLLSRNNLVQRLWRQRLLALFFMNQRRFALNPLAIASRLNFCK